MKIKGVISEDFVNYKVPSMVVEFPRCNFKCGGDYCQNSNLANEPNIDISVDRIIDMYVNNPITEALVCQGLEPFDSWDDLYNLVLNFRIFSDDDIVIYTGYNKDEIEDKIIILQLHKRVVIKYGRFIPNEDFHYDEILGVKLASGNQYAERIS